MKTFEPSWQALQLLSALSEEQGLIRAAQRVAMSQSAASHALAKMERVLGVPLVSREPKGLRLSEAGTRLIPHVNQALRSLEEMRSTVGQLAGAQRGTLRIAAVPSLAGNFVPRLIGKFQRKFPGVEISLFEGTDSEVAEWISTRVAQVGFAALPVKGLDGEEVTRDEWMAVLPAREEVRRVTLAALAKRKFLLSGGGCETHIAILFREAGLGLPASRLLIKQMATIEAMVGEGLGVSVAPSTALRSLRKVRIVPLSPRRYRSIGLLRAEKGMGALLVEAFSKLVREHFQD